MRARAPAVFDIGLLLLPAVVAWTFLPVIADAFSPKIYLASTGALLLIGAFLFLDRPATLVVPKGVVGFALAALVLWAGLSALGADHPLRAAREFVLWLPLLALFLCVYNTENAARTQRHVEIGIVIAAAGVALFGLKQFFLPDVLDPGFHAPGKMSIYSTLGNANLTAFLLLAALPLAVHGLLRAERNRRYLWGGLVAMLAACLLITRSRGALLALGVMLVLSLYWLGPRRYKQLAVAAAVLVFAVAVAWWAAIELPESWRHTVKGRLLLWSTAIAMTADHPYTGVGMGHFGIYQTGYQGQLFESGRYDAFADNAALVSDAHNDFLHWGATTGWIGLLAFGALCAAALWRGWRSRAVQSECPHCYIALAGLVCAMVFSTLLTHAALALVFWLLLAVVLRRAPSPRLELRLPRAARYASAAALALVLALALGWAQRELRAGVLEARGNRLMAEHDLWLASKNYREALAWNPDSGELLKNYAATLYLSGRLGEALPHLERARAFTGDIGVDILEGEIHARLGDYERAVPVYRRIIRAFPNMITPHFVLGQIHDRQGRRAAAEAAFRRVLEIEPSPFNVSMTREKIRLQKVEARAYLSRGESEAVRKNAGEPSS